MRSGRAFIVIGVVLFLGALAVGYVVLTRDREPSPIPVSGEDGTPQPTRLPSMTEIVVAVQDIPRGMYITEDANAVALKDWPVDAVPDGMITDLASVYGKITRVDVKRGMPVLEDMVTDIPGDMGAVGSDASLQIPDGRVAYAVPVARYSSIAWALQPGDHIDVILSLIMVDLDEEFQTVLPNQASCVSPSEGEGCQGGVLGRFEALPNGWVVNVTPREGQQQWPRLVTQLTVQDAIVLQVGDWPRPGEAPMAGEEPVSGDEDLEGDETAPPPPPPSDRVEPLTLAVTRQDAMVLDYAQAIGARMNFVLRRAEEAQFATTESVTLQYLLDRFNMELPPKLPYGVAPPISQLQPVVRNESAAQYGPVAVYGGGVGE